MHYMGLAGSSLLHPRGNQKQEHHCGSFAVHLCQQREKGHTEMLWVHCCSQVGQADLFERHFRRRVLLEAERAAQETIAVLPGKRVVRLQSS